MQAHEHGTRNRFKKLEISFVFVALWLNIISSKTKINDDYQKFFTMLRETPETFYVIHKFS